MACANLLHYYQHKADSFIYFFAMFAQISGLQRKEPI
jgi:hypothetical protein